MAPMVNASDLDQMEPSLERAILRVLSFHRGRGQAVSRSGLVGACARLGFVETERAVREEIKSLRRQGYLICSAPGEDGGYYLANDLTEFEEFARMEYEAKISDMSETVRAMRQAAHQQFGSATQMGLF